TKTKRTTLLTTKSKKASSREYLSEVNNFKASKGRNEMKKLFAVMVAAAALTIGSSAAFAQMMKDAPMVGGAAMYPSKTIVANAMNSADHTTLVAAVKAAGLVETLNGKGPFTVFGPTNDAFAQLPAGTVDMLLQPQNKAMLTKVLTYHVVAGKWDAKALARLIKKGNGQARLKTVSAGTLNAMMNGNNIIMRNEKSGRATETSAERHQPNV